MIAPRRRHFRRFLLAVPLALAATAAALTPARATHDGVLPINDVPLDLESGLGAGFPSTMTVFNIYWDQTWDADNPGFQIADIDVAMITLCNSGYFSRLHQYGGPTTVRFSGSARTNKDICSKKPPATISSLDIVGSIRCQETWNIDVQATGGLIFPFLPVPISAIPFPNTTGDVIYNMIIPAGTTISDLGGARITCRDYHAYHFMVNSDFRFVSPGGLEGRPIYYTVIPVDCFTNVPDLIAGISHEVVEAIHDPLPPAFWIDTSSLATAVTPAVAAIGPACRIAGLLPTPAEVASCAGAIVAAGITSLTAAVGLFTEGEAADICSNRNLGSVPFERGGVRMNVAAYWSNFDNACMVGASRVGRTTFNVSGGVPPSRVTVMTGGPAGLNDVAVGDATAILEGTLFSYPDVVEIDPGKSRYAHSPGACTGTIAYPGGSGLLTDTESCSYGHQYFLDVKTLPTAAASGNASLTASGWYDQGTVASLSADTEVSASPGSRYRFKEWRYELGSLPGPAIAMNSYHEVTAVYELQYRVDFAETGIPPTTPWHVMIDGVLTLGPAQAWARPATSVSFGYETPVVDALVATTRYVLGSLSATSPVPIAAPTTVTATYGTEYELRVATSGLGSNYTAVQNGATLLGAATDAGPLARFLPSGTPLALQVDDPVHGAGGVDYFFDTFSPAPPAALTGGFATTAGYKTMAQQIDLAIASGRITFPPQSTSLKAQFAAAEKHLADQNYEAALGDLESFISLLDAQVGKKVSLAVWRTLIADAADVYYYALCQGVALGQIGAATEATKYAYYVSVVGNVGGVAKPPCARPPSASVSAAGRPGEFPAEDAAARRANGEAGAAADTHALPTAERLYLGPARPTPFSSEAEIQFEVPRSGMVRLGVFDVNGRLIAQLANGWRPAGRSSVTWRGMDDSGRRVHPGVYLYRIVADGTVRSRKLIFAP